MSKSGEEKAVYAITTAEEVRRDGRREGGRMWAREVLERGSAGNYAGF